MGGETGLPFARPRLSSVAAFVGEERERERAREEARAREQALAAFRELTREVAQLVPRLARLHGDGLEVLCAAIHGAHGSPLAALLRRFWADHGDALAAAHTGERGVVDEGEARRVTPAEGGAGRRGQAGAPTPESTKSRAHRTDLFLKLSIRKTLCSPAAEKIKRSGMPGSPRTTLASEEKQRRPGEGGQRCSSTDDSRLHVACKVRQQHARLIPAVCAACLVCDRPCVLAD